MTIKDLVQKVSPGSIKMAPVFGAIVQYILGESQWVKPRLVSLAVTSDGFLIGRPEINGALGHEILLGDRRELERGLTELVTAASLTAEERSCLSAEVTKRIPDYTQIPWAL